MARALGPAKEQLFYKQRQDRADERDAEAVQVKACHPDPTEEAKHEAAHEGADDAHDDVANEALS